jgi:phosphoglycerate dehydrogenase-like enzyme
MKCLIIGSEARYNKFALDKAFIDSCENVFCERGTTDEVLLEKGADADVLLADAISPVSAHLIDHMPNLKMIHTEGVGFNSIDIEHAKKKGIPVCNNKGANATAVAEQTILLMLGLLRDVIVGDAAVRNGSQITVKEGMMVSGIAELADCQVGLVGFGAIAVEVAKLLNAFGAKISYNDYIRRSDAVEKAMNVTYMDIDELVKSSDIVSIHCPVTVETTNMVNSDFLNKMKSSAYLINTARGEIVDNMALRQAIIDGVIAGAAFDTIYPEPMLTDNPLIDLPDEEKYKVIYSPHVGGITTSSFARMHSNLWKNVKSIANGQRPNNIVNGVK